MAISGRAAVCAALAFPSTATTTTTPLPSTVSANPRARHRTKAMAGGVVAAPPHTSSGGGAVLERPAFDQSHLDTLPVTQERGDPVRLRDGRSSSSGDRYKVLLVDDVRHTEKHVEKALPQVVPSITAEAARQLFHESRLKGVAVVIVVVKYTVNKSVEDATDDVLRRVRRGNNKIIYFDGWGGFGAAPVLRSISQLLRSVEGHPPELRFDRVIYVDCSVWENKRTVQRKIAEELKLGHATMAMFDTQDEEDDFNGVDHASRDIITSVAEAIDQTLMGSKTMAIFLNGSDDEIDVNDFGITLAKYRSNVMIWTFKRKFLTIHDSPDDIANKLRYTHLFLSCGKINELSNSELSAVLHKEASCIVAQYPFMRDIIDPTVVMDCCLYELFLHYTFHGLTRVDSADHAFNYFTCAGITDGDTTREISNVLHQEIRWKCEGSLLRNVFEKITEDSTHSVSPIFGTLVHSIPVPGATVTIENRALISRHFSWLSVTSEFLSIVYQISYEARPGSPSSLFLVFDWSNDPLDLFSEENLPVLLDDEWLKHYYFTNLGVLILFGCAFSFQSPPFLWCQTVKFVELNHCKDSDAGETDHRNPANWAPLCGLTVLDLRHTDWDEILSEEKMEIMANLRELNIEGVSCYWQYTAKLQKRLPHLEKLRIIKPAMHSTATPTDTDDSFMDKKRLEILDLSGNGDMKNLPTSITEASNLQVLVLDGCGGLENVVLPGGFPSSLRSFSFDGYGPASHWKSTTELPDESSRPKSPTDASERGVKTTVISLQGCTQLENLFLRGLPNVVELDLSGSPIKVLDFKVMVVDVPNLKRLFLLGCEHLRAINWGSSPRDSMVPSKLKLLCIDTRGGWSSARCTRPSIDKYRSFKLQVHAILADMRLARSLWSAIGGSSYDKGVYFNISITHSASEQMVEPGDHQELVLAGPYGDVFTEVGYAPSPMQDFPPSPVPQLECQVEISAGSRIMEKEMESKTSSSDETNIFALAHIMTWRAESLNVHDSMAISRLPSGPWQRLRRCRVVRCPRLDAVFPEDFEDGNHQLETVWASDLPATRCIWSKAGGYEKKGPSFGNLRHLHLRSCPRLRFVLPVWVRSFPNLRTLHVVHCGGLKHIFVVDKWCPEEISTGGVLFPRLATIHLHDLPELQQISEFKMVAPSLKTVRIRGCFGLRRLPAVAGRREGAARRPVVEMEKDVWDALEWDGLAAGHHPDLFEPPMHPRHYRRRRLRSTVLR